MLRKKKFIRDVIELMEGWQLGLGRSQKNNVEIRERFRILSQDSNVCFCWGWCCCQDYDNFGFFFLLLEFEFYFSYSEKNIDKFVFF